MLELKNVSFSIEGDHGTVEILKNVDLNLEEHKLYVITGPNGGGKSSLAKVLMGIYKPTGGQIFLRGEDITERTIGERAKMGMGYAFQHPPRFKGITVSELLELAGNKEKSCNLLYDVGLCPQDYLNREVDGSLSGGELKRIEIATLLARELQVAVFDEPEAGIDLWSFSKLQETFKIMHEKYPTTIVIISHQERILSLADEIILIADGTVKQQGSKDEMWPLLLGDVSCTCRSCSEGGKQHVECYR